MAPKFVRNKITGIVYDFNPAALKRPENDYEPYDGEPVTHSPGENLDPAIKAEKILQAVKSIDPAKYGRPTGGKPAMPKVADVTDAAGFKVSAEEIAHAMQSIKPE